MTYEDNLKEHFLVNLHELLIPLFNICRLLAGVGLVVLLLDGVVAVVLAPFDNFAEDSFVDLGRLLAAVERVMEGRLVTHVGDGDGVVLLDTVVTNVLEHVLDKHGALSYDTVCKKGQLVMGSGRGS